LAGYGRGRRQCLTALHICGLPSVLVIGGWEAALFALWRFSCLFLLVVGILPSGEGLPAQENDAGRAARVNAAVVGLLWRRLHPSGHRILHRRRNFGLGTVVQRRFVIVPGSSCFPG